MKKFEIGKTYTCSSILNHDCTWSFTVIDRTPKTITVLGRDGIQRLKISKKISEYRNSESVYPIGRYSMAPIMSAED